MYVPIAARDMRAIETYVGKVIRRLSSGVKEKALLVESHEPEPPDSRLGVWALPESAVLHAPRQVWVHVDYSGYRRAYSQAFPDINLATHVLDHVMNRRAARLNGFAFLRIVPISRAANASHGGTSERWGVEYHSSPAMRERNRESEAAVQYADLADIVKMLNMEGGGSVMEIVNEAQKLVCLPDRM